MNRTLSGKSIRIQWVGFGVFLAVVVAACLAYGVNMFLWKDATDYGWRAMYDSGPNVVDEVFNLGRQAGLRPGDRILSINGRSYDTFDDLFFSVRNPAPGDVNTYTVLRDGHPVDINIYNQIMGLKAVLKRSGPLFLVGLLYIFIGAVVFYMKPRALESSIFLLMCAVLGVCIGYASPSDLMRPLSLFKLRQFFDILLPAPIIHLALVFPRQSEKKNAHRRYWFVPYVVSLAIFLFFRPFSATYWDPPDHLDLVNNLYLLAAVLTFILLTLRNLRSVFYEVKVQSRMVLLGISAAFLIPVLELLGRNLLDVYLFSDPLIPYTLLFSAFPLSIGYAIVRHDLFAVDVFTKRATGYGLMTMLVGAVYIALAASVNPIVSSFPALRSVSELFPVLFAVLVILFFRPLHERLQRMVDRSFFREKPDYKDTVTAISNALTYVLNLQQVIVRIIHAVRDVMAVDSAGVILLRPDELQCPALFIHESPGRDGGDDIVDECLKVSDPLVLLMLSRKKVITIYDLARDPLYTDVAEACKRRFEELNCTMILPLIARNQLAGILALGRKKSGQFYTRDDVELLTTLANQGAVAIENARLAEKMKDEEIIRANLSKYLSPQVVAQVIKQKLPLDLGGTRKEVTILISDIRGFTRLTRTVAPETLTRILNEYFTEMADLIFENKGSLDKYMGDAIIAVYGAVHEEVLEALYGGDENQKAARQQNPTANAYKTALDMMNRLSYLNRKWSQEYDGFHMEIGIGIDSGEVFLGNVGSPDRMEFTVIGTAVNNAQRFSDSAGPGEIFISEEAAAAAFGGKVRIQEVGEITELTKEQRVLKIVG